MHLGISYFIRKLLLIIKMKQKIKFTGFTHTSSLIRIKIQLLIIWLVYCAQTLETKKEEIKNLTISIFYDDTFDNVPNVTSSVFSLNNRYLKKNNFQLNYTIQRVLSFKLMKKSKTDF